MRKGGVYLAMGDSITWTIATEVYPTKVFKSINKTHSPISHVNKGIGGSTTDEWMSILGMMILNIPFDLVTIGLGMNDCADDDIGVTVYGDNLASMIDTIRKYRPEAEIVLCAPSSTTDAARQPYIQSYRDKMRDIATQKGTFFCDFSQAFTIEQVGTYSADGIHPDEAGHQLIYNVLWPVVQQTNFVKSLV